jgi:hypothetical protein
MATQERSLEDKSADEDVRATLFYRCRPLKRWSEDATSIHGAVTGRFPKNFAIDVK